MNPSRTFAVLPLWVALCLCLSGCSSHEPQAAPAKAQATTPSPRSTPGGRSESTPDSDNSEDETDEGASADEEDQEREAGPQDFHGYRCTVDCSGHEAGYAWAEQNDIRDPDDCGGNSQSFIEGCMSWAEENSETDLSEAEDDN